MALSPVDAFEHASRIRPCSGEQVSGDAVVVRPLASGLFAAIVDVLGHGAEAHAVAVRIEGFLRRYGDADVAGLMTRLHDHLRGTRGAAVGVCAIDAATGLLEYAGTGNTVLRRLGRTDTRLVSHDGVLGQNMRTPRPQSLQLEAGDLVVLHTDGVHERFSSEDLRGVTSLPAKDVVRALVERFGKDYDDAACIAVRYRG